MCRLPLLEKYEFMILESTSTTECDRIFEVYQWRVSGGEIVRELHCCRIEILLLADML